MRHYIAGVIAAAALASACVTAAGPEVEAAPPAKTPPPVQSGGQPVNPHARAMAAFQERVKEYSTLQSKARAGLPALSTESTPEEIHTHQLALAGRIRQARRTAKPGDIFHPDMRIVIRTLMSQVFGGPEGAQLKADIMDENPGRIRIIINERYPDNVPVSMVPPQVLAGLPNLPKELEYRFLGRALILLDVEAHLLVDIMENAIP